MNTSEQHALDFLKHQQYSDVVYEPDGNRIPDFLVNGSIAVEVRELNQNFFDRKDPQGLDEVRIPLMQKIKNLLLSFGAPREERSWFVCFDFKRPVEPWDSLRPKLVSVLGDFTKSPTPGDLRCSLGNGFAIELIPASKPHPSLFLLGAHSDNDAGGWLVGEMARNIALCIEEKSTKRDRHAIQSYPEWWLVLVDRISSGALDLEDRRQLHEQISRPPGWHRIIIVDSQNHRCFFEL